MYRCDFCRAEHPTMAEAVYCCDHYLADDRDGGPP